HQAAQCRGCSRLSTSHAGVSHVFSQGWFRGTAHRVMAKKKRKGSDKKRKVSRSAQGKQRQARRDGWATRQ
ncbi:hypothetical protein HaLaN_14193, partial [Haematococcus lacustris]